ncbi:mitochondrial folate transporter/carrier-like isoform X1 [Centruroides sculpturatus]|uniref:mitochondrial folate transporter/carrier-like isoform X1 n=1 Tax=Centruroides sculpturatus TaxID=218467 RepID=UPI000C6EF894|nr:mitochondrial folate transporter/carrier-like isoform X1 [Centruroides sculpturatus]
MKNISTSFNENYKNSVGFKLLSHIKYQHLVAGIGGGLTSTLILHPLDLLKIRFAVNDGLKNRPKYHNLRNAVSQIVREEGVKGLYRGVVPNCWGAGTAWGFYFLFYNAIKAWMLEGNVNKQLGAGRHMLAAAEAGVLTLFITNPIWVVKTRLCLQYAECNTALPTTKVYKGTLDALIKVYKYEGISGLYKGFLPGMFGVSHGALQFMAYEEMKKFYANYYNLPPDAKLGTLEYLNFAALSKLFAASVTYPYQVVRARLQDQHKSYAGVVDVLKKTWRFEGIRGFYKGLPAYLIHVTPNICIVFLVYEKFRPSDIILANQEE